MCLQDVAFIGRLKLTQPTNTHLNEKSKEAWFNFVKAESYSGVLFLKVKWTKELTYFLLSLYLHQTLKWTILSEIWVKIFLPKPL